MLFASGQESTGRAPFGRKPSAKRAYKYDICGLINIHYMRKKDIRNNFLFSLKNENYRTLNSLEYFLQKFPYHQE